MKRVAVIAGTSEATELIRRLPDTYEITAFVATEYGGEILKNASCKVLVGRLDEYGFKSALLGMDAVIDASHPFALEVTAVVRKACNALDIPYFRLGRPRLDYDYSGIIRVQSKEEAAKCLSQMKGNILLTTGVNTLSFYETHVKDFVSRGWARILDTEDSRRIAANSNSHIIYAMPPFSMEDTVSLIQKYKIAVLVSKDSGKRGGVEEKIFAAKSCDIPVVLITAPNEEVNTISQVIEKVKNIKGSV